MPEEHQTIFADSDAHIWQDTTHHVWVKEIIEEVLRRLSLVFEALPDRFSLSLMDIKFGLNDPYGIKPKFRSMR